MKQHDAHLSTLKDNEKMFECCLLAMDHRLSDEHIRWITKHYGRVLYFQLVMEYVKHELVA